MATTYKRIESVYKTTEILTFLAHQKEGASGADIARAVDLPKGTVMCHLATLEEVGFVQQVNGAYRIGMKLAIFWARAKSNLEGEITRKQRDLDSISIGGI